MAAMRVAVAGMLATVSFKIPWAQAGTVSDRSAVAHNNREPMQSSIGRRGAEL
jgi:hypothetical protein